MKSNDDDDNNDDNIEDNDEDDDINDDNDDDNNDDNDEDNDDVNYDNRDLKQTLEVARWTSTGSKISRSRANYHNHVEFCPRPPTVAAARKVGFTASRDGHFIFRFVARKIHGNSSI